MPKITRQTDQEKSTVKELRTLYGGMMSIGDICTEIGRSVDAARRWIRVVHLDHIDINGRASYRTSDVALAIERMRHLG